MTQQGDGPDSLVTALGVKHRLRRLCSRRVLMEKQARVNRQPARELLEAKVGELTAANWRDPLTYFVRNVTTAVSAFDWDAFDRADVLNGAAGRSPELAAAFEEYAKALPLPEVPTPSVWVLSRVWMLSEGAVAPSRVSVQLGGVRLGLTGRSVSVHELAAAWRGRVQEFVNQAGPDIAKRASRSPDGKDVSVAGLELDRHGQVKCKALLFLPGPPARIGWIIPSHDNTALGRRVNEDVAITSLFEVPPQLRDLRVYGLAESGRWEPIVRMPSGLCFGGGAPLFDQAAPGLSMAIYLRWAAGRVVMNGKFHS